MQPKENHLLPSTIIRKQLITFDCHMVNGNRIPEAIV